MESNECEWVGSECGTHAAYTFYKGLKYRMSSGSGHPHKWKVMGIGQFLFVRIWGQTDLVSVAEVQLLWEDKSTSQKMCSIRLYFLPEFTSEGRLPHHGEDEMVAVAEKGVLRVVDLLDWLVPLHTLNWDRGAKSVATRDCPDQPESDHDPTSDKTKLDLSEVDQARIDVGDDDIEERGILILSASNYHRYRALHKRLEGVENEWMKNNLISALGGFTTLTRNTSIMFAKEIFDYPELEEHPQLSNHLAPKMKGRPRKKQSRNAQNDDELSPSNEANDHSFICDNKVSNGRDGYLHRGGGRKEILSALIINNSPQEVDFLSSLIKFLDDQGTSIEKPPSIGLKQIDLYSMYMIVQKLGGYESCMANKSWKQVFDTLEVPSGADPEPGGTQNNNSAGAQAVHTRRHYERYLLAYERHMMLNSTNTDTDGAENSLAIKSIEKERKPEITLDENSGLTLLDGKPDPIIKPGNLAISKNSEEPVKTESKVQPKQSKQYLGIKPLQLLTEPKDKSPSPSTAVSDAHLHLSKLILPSLGGSLDLSSPLGGGGLDDPGSGSALQNLAKIASRYSKDKSRTQEFLSPGSKRQRLIDPTTPPGVIQPLPATPASASPSAAMNSSLAAAAVAMAGVGAGGSAADGGITASALLQQFSLMSPLLSGLTSSSNAATSQEGYNLLKYYEQQWKLLQQQGSSVSGGSSSHGSTPPPSLQPPTLQSSSRKESSPALASTTSHNDKNKDPSKIGKEKNKVNKPPPDTVKPPRLLQNPCQFLQTSTIYGSPKSDLDKVKENAIKAGVLHLANTSSLDGQGVGGPQPPVTTQLPNQVLDLSSGCMEFRTVSPHHRSSLGNLSSLTPPPPSQDKRPTINNRTPTTTSSVDNGIDLRMNSSRTSTPQGAKNFSAEALIGNNNSSNSSPSSHTFHSSSPSSHTHNKQSSGREGGGSPVKRPSSSTPTWHPASSSSPGMNRNSSGPRASPSLGGVSHRSAYSPLSSPSAASALQQQYQLAAAQSSSTTSASAANAAYLQALMMSSKGATSTSSSASSSAAAQSAASQYAAAMAAALGGSSSQQAAMMAALGGSSSQQAAMAAALGGSSSQQAAMMAALGGGSSSQQAAMMAALGGSSSSQQAALAAALSGGSSSQQAAMIAALGGSGSSQQAALGGGSSSQQAAMLAALGGGSSSQQAAIAAALGGSSSSQQAAMLAALGGGSSSQQAAMIAALGGSSSSQQAAIAAALGGSNANSQAAMAAALSGQPQRGMDPLMSQYYSMLYSQQLAAAAAYNPYAAAAMSAGMQPPSTTSSSGRSAANISSIGGSNSAYNQLMSSQGGPNSSSSFPGIYSTSSSLAGANLLNSLSYSSAGGSTSAASSYSNNHSSAASLSSLYGLYPPTSVPVTGSSSSLAAAMAAAAGTSSSANSSTSLAAQLAAASGGSMSSYSSANLAALMGSAPSSMSGSSSLAAMAAGSGFTGGAGSGLSMMPSSLGVSSSSGSGSGAPSATELQMYQAYQDLLSRSSAPNSSSMFNMGAFLGGGAGAGHPHNLGQRKE